MHVCAVICFLLKTRDKMHRFLKPITAVLCGGGGVFGLLLERKKEYDSMFFSVAQAKKGNENKQQPAVDNQKIQQNLKRRNEIMRFGYPSYDNIKYKENYVLSYNRRLRQANWVCEHLNMEVLKKRDTDRSKCDFILDRDVHPLFRSTNEDYRKTGYDRGHLAAAANHKLTQESNCQTFFLSNISPQVGSGFNRDSWEHLEKYVRHLVKSNKNVYIITGPLFLPKLEQDGQLYVKYKVIGNNRIAVPTHFFKVILTETNSDKYEMQSYILPNQPINKKTALHMFQVPVETIEKASGLLMFDKLPRKNVKMIRPTF